MLSGIEKQVDYWIRSSRQDRRVGHMLLAQRKTRHGLFFLHLSLEKLLKAMVCRATQKPAPRIHSLPFLAERAKAVLEPKHQEFLAKFDRFNLAARYPDDVSPIPRHASALKLEVQFKELYQCLAKQL